MFAWDQMIGYKRLLRWSWVSRGLVTEEEMKALHPTLDDLHTRDPPPSAVSELIQGIPALVPILDMSQQHFEISRLQDVFKSNI